MEPAVMPSIIGLSICMSPPSIAVIGVGRVGGIDRLFGRRLHPGAQRPGERFEQAAERAPANVASTASRVTGTIEMPVAERGT